MGSGGSAFPGGVQGCATRVLVHVSCEVAFEHGFAECHFQMPRDNEMITDGDNEEESASVHQDEATDAEHEKWACSVG